MGGNNMYQKLEIGMVFKRNEKIYKMIGSSDKRMIISIPVEEPVCECCGNRFIEYDVESAPSFQESIEPVQTILKQ